MISARHSPILQAIERHATETPDKPALLSSDLQISYGELWARILSATSLLESLSIAKGDSILIGARKEPEFIYVYFAAHLLGIINVVVDPASSLDKLTHIDAITSPKLILGLKNFCGKSSETKKYTDFDFSICSPLASKPSVNADDIADIMFTTGTTGLPKGVCLSHSNIFGSASNINSFICNKSDDVEIIGLPLSHSFGLGRMRCTLLKGATLVLLGNFANVKLFFDAIERYNATGFGMVPAVWEYISRMSGDRIAKYAQSIRYIEIGSAEMPVKEKERLIKLFPNARICMHYGSTEASRSLFMEFHEYAENLKSIGRPASDKVDVKILDDDGLPVHEGQCGELCVKGNMVMKGYLLAEDNQNAFFGDYFRTGDLGCVDGEGNYYLVGRRKEIINVGGEKVSPATIEEAIKSLGVADCAVVPTKDPKGILGEAPKAYIQKTGCSLDFSDIRSGLAGKLEPHELPIEYEWIDRIPRTSTGKIQRTALMN